MSEPSDEDKLRGLTTDHCYVDVNWEDVDRRLAEYDGHADVYFEKLSECSKNTTMFYRWVEYENKASPKSKYTEDLDRCCRLVSKLELKAYLEYHVAADAWDAYFGEFDWVRQDESPSRALSLAIYQVLGER